MPLNNLQKQVMSAILGYMFSAVIDEVPIAQSILGLQAIFNDQIYQENRERFAQHNFLENIDQIRQIKLHPCPQNRTTGNPYVGQEPGLVVYRDADHHICREPIGLLSLTAQNDAVTAPVTKEDVVQYLQEQVNARLLELQTIYLRQLQQDREREASQLQRLQEEVIRLRAIALPNEDAPVTESNTAMLPNFFQTPTEILLNRVQEHLAQHNNDGAIHLLNILINREPSEPQYRYLRGRSLAVLDRRTEALTDFNIAIKHRRNHAQSYVERGFTLENIGANGIALRDYNNALALEPNHAFALCRRAGLYMEMGRREEALAGYTASLQIKEDPSTYNSRGRWLLTSEDYRGAISDFNDSLRLRPNQPNIAAMRQEARRLATAAGILRNAGIEPEEAQGWSCVLS